MDKAKSEVFRCNDHLNRLWLDINYVNKSEIFFEDYNYNISFLYSIRPCQNSSEQCGFRQFSRLSSNSSTLKLIINSYYEYQFQLNLSKSLKNVTDNIENDFLCINLNFVKFDQCNQYVLNVYPNMNCTLSKIKSGSEFPFVKYLYLSIGLLLAITVMANLIKISFFRYQLLK
ncbi:unnamed protein product [Brachionus calyciflorus]|uniref:Uncharacterized protein n=1 Tax=Brachionus calyciflorus TaxID=104777 RepID=A0A813RDB7_9BILA|nr:unnamed protein product [Brachionus calyciflorus]